MEMTNPAEFMEGYFTHVSILAKTLVGLNIELIYRYKIGGVIDLGSAQGFLSSLVLFLTLDGHPLPIVSEKSPFVRVGCFFKSNTVPIYITQKTKRIGESLTNNRYC